MEGMFRRLGIYSSVGQLYEPVDSDQVAYYREDKKGQILQEGINEAGAMASWIAAGTSYATSGLNMVPFYICYSMFGFQRTHDLAWAAGDMQTRGFLLGGTAGRTTLAGEGLQHQDGHSHILSSTIPNCVSYDPAYAYELAVIIQEGLRRMFVEQEDLFYYITVMNEKYVQPALPRDAEAGILKGMYRVRESELRGPHVQMLGSGTILREVLAAADMLEQDFGVAADVFSVTSFTELRREGMDVERWNMLHPEEKPRLSYVERQLAKREGPVVAATDYMRSFADQIRPFVKSRYRVLGTDGFGRSDGREKLRRHFEVDRNYVCTGVLSLLAEEGAVDRSRVTEAIGKYGIDPEKPNPACL
jgi:pyruvate dehydrogenase E1 component